MCCESVKSCQTSRKQPWSLRSSLFLHDSSSASYSCSSDCAEFPSFMATLSPPPNRHRASSTSLRPPLTINSCASRKRSNSELPTTVLSPVPATPAPDFRSPEMEKELSLNIPTKAHSYLAKATFAEFYSRFMDLLHIAHKESAFPSEPSSPRQSRSSFSDEDSILPISSPVVATFGDAVSEKLTAKSTSWWQGSPSVRSAVLILFV